MNHNHTVCVQILADSQKVIGMMSYDVGVSKNTMLSLIQFK